MGGSSKSTFDELVDVALVLGNLDDAVSKEVVWIGKIESS